MEDASQRVEDIRRVVDFLVTLPYIKVDSIGVLGICGGGGYALNATMTEKRIKAVVSITGVNFGRLMREGFSLYDALGSLEAMAKQRTAEATGVPVKVNAVLPTSVADAAKQGLTDRDIVQATDYYRARAPHPSGATSMVYSHLSNAVSWDAFNFCETLLNQPILVVTGDQVGSFGAYRDGLEIYGRAVLSKERELAVLEGVSHYELYDQPEPVKKALDKVIPFFSKYLV